MRERGFYWVQFLKDDWIVCFWNSEKWLIPGLIYDDIEIIEIDERRIVRQPECGYNELKGARLLIIPENKLSQTGYTGE